MTELTILYTFCRQHIHALQNRWDGYTLHSRALAHYNSRCHQQLRSHNTKHKYTTRVPNNTHLTGYHHGVHHTIQPDIVDTSTRTIIWPLTNPHHNQHTTWLYTITKPMNLQKLPKKTTGHNLPKTQSPLSLRPQYPPIYILLISFSQTSFWWQTSTI